MPYFWAIGVPALSPGKHTVSDLFHEPRCEQARFKITDGQESYRRSEDPVKQVDPPQQADGELASFLHVYFKFSVGLKLVRKCVSDCMEFLKHAHTHIQRCNSNLYWRTLEGTGYLHAGSFASTDRKSRHSCHFDGGKKSAKER
jgi:hypothetical protein